MSAPDGTSIPNHGTPHAAQPSLDGISRPPPRRFSRHGSIRFLFSLSERVEMLSPDQLSGDVNDSLAVIRRCNKKALFG
ncbi:MAG: hypothetical protein F4089_06000 [Gammaproteobacteria bacterium]|nr:hypothetical protein [Gammaproteobacteria bacterium]MYJ74666.1 hypothetical protein [Gammaproteobacteria bacterium]